MNSFFQKPKRLLTAGVLLLGAGILAFLTYKSTDHGQEPVSAEDFFAYTDSENKLYLWKEGSDGPLLLTDQVFAVQGEDSEIPYWEAWEYWEEWDETKGVWIQNEEKAFQDVIWETSDGSLLFPKNMRWEVSGMQRGAMERKEALAYVSEEELEDWMKVRAFCYDLYRQSSDTEKEPEKVAERVLFYSVDEKGAVWYCQAAVDGTVQINEEELPCTCCTLYRYDGEKHQKIGEIDGRKQEPYWVEKDGTSVVFYGLDDSLYRCRPGEEPRLLAESADSLLYRDRKRKNLIYARDGCVYMIQGSGAETKVYEGEEEQQSVGVLGREGETLFVLEASEDVRYTDWITLDGEEMDADTARLWELMEQAKPNYYPFFCTVRVMDLTASPAKTIDATEGYVLIGPVAEEDGVPKDVYYMEMIPADSFEKIPLSELLGSSLPEDVLRTYAYYLDSYGEDDPGRAFAWALEDCWERDAFENRSSVYAVTKTGIHLLEGLEEGLVLGTSKDYSSDGSLLYLIQYQSPNMESDYRRYGHHLYYGYLENRYALDGDGNCRKAAELADESIVVGNEVFYSRNMGLEGYVNLYGADHEEELASAADISLESLKKSEISDTYLFLAEGLITEEEGETIPVYAQKDLRESYKGLGIEQDRFSDEKDLHTLVLYREGRVRELEKEIYSYGFYGEDSVWMLQHEQKELSGTEENDGIEDEYVGTGSLLVCENGETERITDQAVWIMKAGSKEGARSASWIFE